MTEKILFVDDDDNLLASFERSFHIRLDIITARSGADGLAALQNKGPFAVIVSDYRMPVMDGIKFLSEARKIAPDVARIMLTGLTDINTAIKAVNDGYLFRFLTKPCPPDDLYKTIIDAIEQYRLAVAEKELLENTLHSSIKVMSEILSMISPDAFSHSIRVGKLAKNIATHLKIDNLWEVEIAAMLSQIGCVTIPEQIVERKFRGEPLDKKEDLMFLEHPLFGQLFLAEIPRLEGIAEAIAYQQKQFDGGGFPDDPRQKEEIPLIARILKAAIDFDLIISPGKSGKQVIAEMRQNQGWYDPAVLIALNEVFTARPYVPADQEQSEAPAVKDESKEPAIRYVYNTAFDKPEQQLEQLKKDPSDGIEKAIQDAYEAITNKKTTCKINIKELEPRMVIAEDIYTTDRILLISRGQEITEALMMRLINYNALNKLAEPFVIIIDKTG